MKLRHRAGLLLGIQSPQSGSSAREDLTGPAPPSAEKFIARQSIKRLDLNDDDDVVPVPVRPAEKHATTPSSVLDTPVAHTWTPVAQTLAPSPARSPAPSPTPPVTLPASEPPPPVVELGGLGPHDEYDDEFDAPVANPVRVAFDPLSQRLRGLTVIWERTHRP
jgi:hypothetical protein